MSLTAILILAIAATAAAFTALILILVRPVENKDTSSKDMMDDSGQRQGLLLENNENENENDKDQVHDLSKLVVEACYINLDERTDRLFYVVPTLKYWGFKNAKRISAVKFSPGYKGCTKSHIVSLQHAKTMVTEEQPWYLVAEDDIDVNKDRSYLIPYIQQALAGDIKDLKVLCLTHNVQKWGPDSNVPHIARMLFSYCASCYIIHKDYIDVLINCFEQSLLDNVPLDVQWKTLQERDGWYAMNPAMGKQGASFSNIENIFVDYGV